MAVRQYTNNGATTLNGAIGTSDTTITLTDASSFPAPTGGNYAFATIDDGTNVEVIKYTGVSTNDLTGVTRGQEGTSGTAFADLAPIEVRATAASFSNPLEGGTTLAANTDLQMQADVIYWSGGGTSTYHIGASGGVPYMRGASGYEYTFTSSALVLQAATSSDQITFKTDATGMSVKTSGTNRFTVNDSGATVSNGTLVVSANNVEAAGISFDSGTNVMDYYEEGTFTPVLADASTGGNTATAATTIGRYTRIGRQVIYNVVLINVDTTGMTGANQLFLRSLPFTSANPSANNAVPSSFLAQSTTSTTGSIGALSQPNTTYIQLYNQTTSGITILTVSSLSSGVADLYFNGYYEV